MDLPPNQEVEIPMPLNSSYAGHGHVPNMFNHHHYHHEPSPNHHFQASPSNVGPAMPMTQNHENNNNHHQHEHKLSKKQQGGEVRYRECLKNHAASMGGNVTDGCGEFMPSGEENTIEALTCSVCNCHRNFHRKEVEGEASSSPMPYDNYMMMINSNRGRKVIQLGHHKNMLSPAGGFGVGVGGYPTSTAGVLVSGGRTRSVPYNMGVGSLMVSPDHSDDQEEGGAAAAASGGVAYMGLQPPPPPLPPSSHHHHNQLLKKRFRTKFTPEQKEKMFNFAEKVGWKIQKQEESVVQHFCQEIGVKRRVLKVWMHNNKTKKNPSTAECMTGRQEEPTTT